MPRAVVFESEEDTAARTMDALRGGLDPRNSKADLDAAGAYIKEMLETTFRIITVAAKAWGIEDQVAKWLALWLRETADKLAPQTPKPVTDPTQFVPNNLFRKQLDRQSMNQQLDDMRRMLEQQQSSVTNFGGIDRSPTPPEPIDRTIGVSDHDIKPEKSGFDKFFDRFR